jgi:hypothetical protein
VLREKEEKPSPERKNSLPRGSFGAVSEKRKMQSPAVSAVSEGVTFVMPKESTDEGVVETGGGDRDAPRT